MKEFFVKVKHRILFEVYKIPEYSNRGDDVLYGKYRVRYPDNKVSQKMCYASAKTYSQIFGGIIIFNFE